MRFANDKPSLEWIACALRYVSLSVFAAALSACGTLPTPPEQSNTAGPVVRAVPVPAAPTDAVAAREFDAALVALRAGRVAEAEQRFRALTRAYPELPGPHANLGIACYRQNKLSDAVAALNEAIRLNPRQAAYYNALGIAQRHAGEFARAREAYANALALDPLYAKAHLNLGILHDLYLRDADKALQHYTRYQELLPSAEEPVQKWIVDLQRRRQTADRKGKEEHG